MSIAYKIIKENEDYKSLYDVAFEKSIGMTVSPQFKIFDFSDGSKMRFCDKYKTIEYMENN